MKALTVIAALVFLAGPSLAAPDSPAFPQDPLQIRASYSDALYEMLVQCVKDNNLAGAKLVVDKLDELSASNLTASNTSVCGTWLWNDGASLVMLWPNGGVGLNSEAKWKWVDEKARKLQIKWKAGWVDNATMSEDGQTLHCVNNVGTTFDAHRVPTE